jgi:hypothetical protein
MNNEPVAYIDPYDLKRLPHYDCHIGSQQLKNGIPLYTHPVKEQYKFGVDWSKDGNAVTVLKICEDGVAEVVFMDYQEVTHPVKELTDEEKWEVFTNLARSPDLRADMIRFADSILKKAQKK